MRCGVESWIEIRSLELTRRVLWARRTLNRKLSVCAALLHQFNKSFEMVLSVVRPRCGFGMVLNRDNWKRLMAHAFDAAIVEVYVRDFDFGWQRVCLDREAVVFGSDLNVAVA